MGRLTGASSSVMYRKDARDPDEDLLALEHTAADADAATPAGDDEAAQRKYYTEKYKLYPFIKFKNFLKQNKIPEGDVDNCLSKFELKKLAEKHGVAIPDDPKSLTADNNVAPLPVDNNMASLPVDNNMAPLPADNDVEPSS